MNSKLSWAENEQTSFSLQRLYDLSQWSTIAKTFRLAIYTLNTLSTEPLLNLALYAGLVALKVPACFDHSTKNVDCPVCDGESGPGSQPLGLGKLAKEVPYSHHANSTIVCQISGKIMDEDNMPMAFPDGHVYSREVRNLLFFYTLPMIIFFGSRRWKRWRQRMMALWLVHGRGNPAHSHYCERCLSHEVYFSTQNRYHPDSVWCVLCVKTALWTQTLGWTDNTNLNEVLHQLYHRKSCQCITVYRDNNLCFLQGSIVYGAAFLYR